MENQPHSIILALSLLFTFCSSLKSAEVSRMRYVMGTILQIQVQAKVQETAEKAIEAGLQEVERLDQLLSNWKEDSEISRINREAYPNGTKTTEEMIDFLLTAKQLSELTSGYFDITIEPLTQLWKLREGKLEKMPTEEEIEKVRAKVGWKNLELSTTTRIVRFLVEGMGIDTGGIGKGYALDKALEKITGLDIESVTLNFGGQILFWSKEPKQQKIAIKNPLKPDKIWKKITLEKCPQFSASTSGNYEKGRHILNPKTGIPVETPLRSVTVISQNATEADAYSTAIFAMDLQEGLNFTNSQKEIGVINLYETPEGRLIEVKRM